MTAPKFPWLPNVLTRYRVECGALPSEPADNDALASLLATLSADERVSVAESAIRKLEAGMPFGWALPDAIASLTQANVDELFRAEVMSTDDPFELCELGSALLARSTAKEQPLKSDDFADAGVPAGAPPSWLAIPTSSRIPNVLAPESIDSETVLPLAVLCYGLAWCSLKSSMTDVNAPFDWEAAWLGLLSLEGLRAAFVVIDDIEGLIAVLIFLDAWCERVRGAFPAAAETFVSPFESRFDESLAWAQGRMGVRKGAAISFPLTFPPANASPSGQAEVPPDMQAWMQRMDSMMQRTLTVASTTLQSTVQVGEAMGNLERNLSAQQDLLLDAVLKLEEAADEIGDQALRNARDGLLELLTERDREEIDAGGNDLIGAVAWDALDPESSKDLRAFLLLTRDQKPELVRSAGLMASIAFERELKLALVRFGIPENEIQQPLGRLLGRAYDLDNSERLNNIAERARREPGLDELRDKAAHPQLRTFTRENLDDVTTRLFVDGLDGHGLLSNVVMFHR